MLYEIHAEENRTVVSFEEIPDYAKQATIVIEDRDFLIIPPLTGKPSSGRPLMT